LTILLLGGIYVAFAFVRVYLQSVRGEEFLSGMITFGIVGIPGLVLLYGGYLLPRTDLDPDTYPRIVGWCGVGFVSILVFLGLLHLEPQNPYQVSFWSTTFSTAIGSAGGLLIGSYDAQTITQARQLQQHRSELQRQNERLDSFASLLAHELRNPLSIVQIYHRQAADGDEDAAETVENALTRIEEMVDVILVIVKGKDADLDREAVDLAAVAKEAWAGIEVPDARFVVETDRVVSADPIHLRHLLENLFENAVEHGSTSPRSQTHENAVEHADGGVTVRIGDLLSGFYVEDDGPGIPEDDRDRVFEAGYTTDGTGFGLMFVAELAETYDWEYTITDGEDGGARFEFTNVNDAPTPKAPSC
jgi:signal transduction histidine kinase